MTRLLNHPTTSRHWKWLFLVVFHHIFDGAIFSIKAEEMMSSYTSMRSLDKFGNSVQIMHAREAAARYGRLVVAARCHPVSTSDEATVVVVSVGTRKVVRSITLPLHPGRQASSIQEGKDPNAGFVAMCCTGVKSDADWLIRYMQRYAANVWERYDQHLMGTPALAHSMSRLLGSYQDGDLEEEWQSAIGRQKKNAAKDQLESPLSRPLGVQTLLLSTNTGGDEPNLLLVEPTGRVFKAETNDSFSFITMGKQSDVLNERLLRTTLNDPSELEKLLIGEILETLSPSRNEITELLVETIGSNPDIDAVILVCKNGQVKSRSDLTSTSL
jgi:hypothetical protein